MGSVSVQTTLMLPPRSTAIRGLLGLDNLFWGLERFVGVRKKFAPPAVERLKKIFEVTDLQSERSCQTTLILPLASRAMTGLKAHPRVLERFIGREKLMPPSVERLKRILELLAVSSSQTT